MYVCVRVCVCYDNASWLQTQIQYRLSATKLNPTDQNTSSVHVFARIFVCVCVGRWVLTAQPHVYYRSACVGVCVHLRIAHTLGF